jgi:hypothetical protein
VREIEFISLLDNLDLNRIRVRLITESGKLTDVMYQFESFINKKWVAIVRYDCAHGFFHRDIIQPNGDKEKQLIEMDSLKSASKYAEQDIKDRWEWYRERYIKKLKKDSL